VSVVRGLPRAFREVPAILGESIVWDAAAREVLWCDITSGLLHRSPIDGATDGSDDTSLSFPPPLASFHLSAIEGTEYVVSLGDRLVLADADGGIVRELAPIEHVHSGLRMNEGKVDPAGRWVSGSMNLTTGEADGAIYSVDEQGTVRVIAGGLGVANGFDWSDDGRTMYYGDTGTQTIYCGAYSEGGELSDVGVFHAGESHDGLAMDVDGHLWSGVFGGGKVVRYAPDGSEAETIELPVPNVTSVAFGGDDLSTLFVATAREQLTEEELAEHPLSGSVFAVETSTYGRPPRTFGAGESC